MFKINLYSRKLYDQFTFVGGIFLKKKICIIVSVILSVLLCACLFYNLVAGAPQDYESAIRYMISAAGVSVIVSGFSGYSIFKIFSFEVAEDEDIKETRNVIDKSYQGSFTEFVNALDKKKLSDDDINRLRSFLDIIDNSKSEK